jgi:signal transduction histidine kinase
MISNVICAMEKKYESDRKMISISFDSKNNIPNHDLLIACDADKIIQVLFHLLDNAMKFTERKINNGNIQIPDIVVVSGELHSRLVCRYIVAPISLQPNKK